MRVSKQAVIEAACNIADKEGLSGVSLKAVAEKLAIRAPSLYNHIESLEQLLHEVAHVGMKEMNLRMTRCAIGVAGEDAVIAIAFEYLGYMVEHPGVYETIQWATWHDDDETAALFEQYLSLVASIIERCDFNSEDVGEIVDLLTGFLHGYTTMQAGYAFTDMDFVKERFKKAIEAVMLGIRQKYA